MAYPPQAFARYSGGTRRSLLYPILTLWGLVAVCLATVFISVYGFSDQSSKYYLLPWCLATGTVISAPSIVLIYQGRFNPFHPLVFPAWSYFLPGFFVGGLVVAFGLSQPYFLSYIQDETYNLPLTFVYIMLGFGGLTGGFSIPYAKRLGFWISTWLPKWEMPSNRIASSGLILLGLGLANTFAGFALGLFGFQKVAEAGIFDGIIYLLSLFLLEASFLLWLYIFRRPKIGFSETVIILILLSSSFAKSAFWGNRGSLIQLFILVTFAYSFSGRKIAAKQYAFGGVLVTLALIVGMIYGTTFRTIKGSEEQISFDRYVPIVSATFEKLADEDLSTMIGNGLDALTERIDSVSPLAVVVSNYEALSPYEEAWGINNNIYVDTVTFFIPRVVWPEKPVAIDPSKYADLYFNFSENSFTITPMGDLLRNFGPLGVPLGMILLGAIIRILYASLIEGQQFSYWRLTFFYMLFSNISFEGTYGLIIPILFKVGVLALVGLLIVRLFAGSSKTVS
jgi:hypothetical protein